MSTTKRVLKKDLDDFIDIVANAYPGMKIITREDKRKLKKRILKRIKDKRINLYGFYEKVGLLGVMALYDFKMNLFGIKTIVGGVGLVAVDLLHKKEKICKNMMGYFLNHYLKQGSCMTALYPFRPDFYRKMGFGYGTKINRYSIKPTSLPAGNVKAHTKFLSKKDIKEMAGCYGRYYEKRHGLMQRNKFDFNRFFENPKIKVIGFRKKKKILGYLIFSFEPVKDGNFLLNDIHIFELIYENKHVLMEMFTFLRSQSDQINRVIFETQDENFHFIPIDPRDDSTQLMRPVGHQTNRQGVGIMYRVINTKSLFEVLQKHNFNDEKCKLKIRIKDSFFKKNDGSIIIHFINGRPQIKRRNYEVTISLDISDFSSLIMGVVDFRSLFKYGLAGISDGEYVDLINRLFLTKEKPICLTDF